MQEQIDNIKSRITALEGRVNEMGIRQGTMIDRHNDLEKSFVEMRADLHHVRSAVDKINNGVNRAIWIFVAAFAAVAVAWIKDGGMIIPHP